MDWALSRQDEGQIFPNNITLSALNLVTHETANDSQLIPDKPHETPPVAGRSSRFFFFLSNDESTWNEIAWKEGGGYVMNILVERNSGNKRTSGNENPRFGPS